MAISHDGLRWRTYAGLVVLGELVACRGAGGDDEAHATVVDSPSESMGESSLPGSMAGEVSVREPTATHAGVSAVQMNAGHSADLGASTTGVAGMEAASPSSTREATDPLRPGGSGDNAWRMMGYDERNWYFNPAERTLSVDNAPQIRELWRFSGVGVPNGSPVIADGRVFAMTSAGTYAIDLETGKELWHRSDITGTASAAYDAGFVYVHHYTPPTMYKLDARDGSTVWGPVGTWDADGSAGTSSPILAAGKVFVGHESGSVELLETSKSNRSRGGVDAIDARSGMSAWAYYTFPKDEAGGENGAAVWSSVSIDIASSMLFMTTGNNYTVAGPNSDAFHAVDLHTGERRWKTQVRDNDLSQISTGLDEQDTDFGANPILAEIMGQPIVAAGDKAGAFWVLDRTTGEILWKREKLSASHSWVAGGVLMNGAFDGEAFYVVSNDPASAGAVLHRLDPLQAGESTWTHRFTATAWGAPSLANGLLVVPNNSTLYVMEAISGRVLTQFETGGTIAGGAAAIAQGKIVVKSGFLNLLDSKTKLNDQIICYGVESASGAQRPDMGAAGAGGSGAGDAGSDASVASFAAVYEDVFVTNGCNGGQCHSGAAAGALDMQTEAVAYDSLVEVLAMGKTSSIGSGCASSGLTRVVPFDPDNSLLVMKLEHTQSCGAAMPSQTTQLPAAQLQLIRDWVSAGAMR